MSRSNKGAFSRNDGEFDYAVGDQGCSDWLTRFAEGEAVKEAVQPMSAVEQARERSPSVYEQISSIVSGAGPKFSSVDEVVADYRKRTGMDTFKISAAAFQIISSAEEDEDDVDDYPMDWSAADDEDDEKKKV